jgi:hypothetical protein
LEELLYVHVETLAKACESRHGDVARACLDALEVLSSQIAMLSGLLLGPTALRADSSNIRG